METSPEALHYFLAEAKDAPQDDVELPDTKSDVEEASEFLQRIGLLDLTKDYEEGKKISDKKIKHSISQRNLTSKQVETIRSRVKTLNKHVISRVRPRKDVRLLWQDDGTTTDSRSRSATPDSLDDSQTDESVSDEDNRTSVPFEFVSYDDVPAKTKIKYTSSEPLQSKKFHKDKGDIAHLDSQNVVLKGYQQLNENGTLPRPQRERSGSDPSTAIHIQEFRDLKNGSADIANKNSVNKMPTSLNFVVSNNTNNNCSKVYIHPVCDSADNDLVSFESEFSKKIDDEFCSLDCDIDYDIDDFSDGQSQNLKRIVYLELISIFDQYEIICLKRKPSKNKGGNVFGVNLRTLVMRDMPNVADSSMVPEIFQIVLRLLNTKFIKEDGVLRVAGQKQKLENLCQQIETKFYTHKAEVEALLNEATVHDLTGILKKLLRELPEPIFTMELIDMFYKTNAIPNYKDKLKALNLLVLNLPDENRNTFRVLLNYFINITKHESDNRMGARNVAMITAPSFFPPRLLFPKYNAKMAKEELTVQINSAAVCCSLMETMLKAGESLWKVSSSLAQQAVDAEKTAQVKKDKWPRTGKVKLTRSRTQYESPSKNISKLKRDCYNLI